MTSHLPLGLCVLAAAAFAQTSPGTVTGVVTDPEGAGFAGAFVSLKNAATGAALNAVSAAGGKYTIAAVAAGTYDLSVGVPGMKAYHRAGIKVEAGQTLVADARLEDGPSLRTLGEDPASLTAVYINRPPPPAGPAPRTLDGRPDFSGVWLVGPAQLPELHMLPWAEALSKERTENNFKDLPLSRCLPSGPVPLLEPGFFKLAQTPTLLVMIVEGDTPGYRQVFLDGRSHSKDFGPTWLGDSIGKWEGDTLVIDSIGFGDKGWLDSQGHPYSDKLHTIQRIRRADLGHLEIGVTVDDAGTYGQEWTVKITANLEKSEEIREYICNENNKDVVHLVGK